MLYTSDTVAGLTITRRWGLYWLEGDGPLPNDVARFTQYIGEATEANAVIGVRIQPMVKVQGHLMPDVFGGGSHAPARDVVGASVGFLIYGNPVVLQ
jgi:hypothetical protein